MTEQAHLANADSLGLKCKVCGCRDLYITHTKKGPGYVMRRRKCRHCGESFKSFEK